MPKIRHCSTPGHHLERGKGSGQKMSCKSSETQGSMRVPWNIKELNLPFLTLPPSSQPSPFTIQKMNIFLLKFSQFLLGCFSLISPFAATSFKCLTGFWKSRFSVLGTSCILHKKPLTRSRVHRQNSCASLLHICCTLVWLVCQQTGKFYF